MSTPDWSEFAVAKSLNSSYYARERIGPLGVRTGPPFSGMSLDIGAACANLLFWEKMAPAFSHENFALPSQEGSRAGLSGVNAMREKLIWESHKVKAFIFLVSRQRLRRN